MPLASFLASTVDIENIGGVTKNPSGDAAFAPTARLQAIACCLQPYSATKVAAFAQLGARISHRAYFDTDYAITTTDRLRITGTNRLFEVRGTVNFDELSRLWRVDLEERPQ
jgi:hypothetical protein